MMQQILAFMIGAVVAGPAAFAVIVFATRTILRRRAARDTPPAPTQFAHVKECRIDVITEDGISRIDIDVHYDDAVAACAAVRILGTEMLPTFAHAVGACRHDGESS